MKSSIAVLFYIDALDPRTINHDSMPFLDSLAKTGNYYSGTMENVLGYSFAIQSSMLSGKHPDESGYWLPYCYSPGNTTLWSRGLSSIGRLSLADHVPKLRYLLTRLLRQFFMRKGVQAYNTPFSVLDNFLFFPYYYVNEMPCFNQLGELTYGKYGVALEYLGPPEARGDATYDTFMAKIGRTNSSKMLIVYEDRLDYAAHSFGPSSDKYKNAARHVDEKLGQIYRIINSEFKDPVSIFFSDHSQTDLVGHVDIVSKLANVGLGLGKDYLCFVDATLALFWPRSERAREKLDDILRNLKLGNVIDDQLRKEYHLLFKNRKMYGEIIYVLKPGLTFFPNFYSPFEPMMGLHGYLPDEKVQKAFIIKDNRLSISSNHVRNLKDMILNCCELIQQE